MIKDITAKAELNKIYSGKVMKIMEFGAFGKTTWAPESTACFMASIACSSRWVSLIYLLAASSFSAVSWSHGPEPAAITVAAPLIPMFLPNYPCVLTAEKTFLPPAIC